MPYRKKDKIPVCKRSGVYGITNTVNGKVYVGSAISLRGRMQAHRNCLKGGRHDNEHLQRAWRKYGESAFVFDILEECPPDVLLTAEQAWIDNLDTTNRDLGYNMCPVAGSAMSGRKHTEESRAKMSRAHKGTSTVACTAAAAIANKGRKRSPEAVEKTASFHRGRKVSEERKVQMRACHWTKRPDAAEIIERSAAKHRGKKMSDEHKAKLSASHWKNKENAEEVRKRVSDAVKNRWKVAHGSTS